MMNSLKNRIKIALAIGVIIWIISCTYSQEGSVPADLAGYITAKAVDEASGIAVSRYNDNVVWINNDSGNAAALFAVNRHGKKVFRLNIKGVANRDWEDLAAFDFQGKSYLVIGDVGDNYNKWQSYSLYFVEEPDIRRLGYNKTLAVKPAWQTTFTYADGSRDCEAIAVDVQAQKVLLLSKRESPPVLFELPLKSEQQQPLVAKRLGRIKPIPDPIHTYPRLFDWLGMATWPTGMDISPDGKQLLVLTYGGIYRYRATPDHNWFKSLSQSPEQIPLPELKQAEAIGFDRQARHFYVTTEKLPAPLLYMSVPGQSPKSSP
jgi:hypothetical protein